MTWAALVGTGWYEVAVFAENGLCRFVHRISSFLPETYVAIAFILTYRGRDRDWDRVAATLSFRPEWRNLPAEWGWWLSAPDGAVGVGIKDRGAVERVFANGKF